MKIEDQVLSVKQVQELQELGFDVRKHASLYFVEEKYFVKENFIVLPEQIDITRVPEDVKITPTMTIGDIIDVLPMEIKIEEDWFSFRMSKISIEYFNMVLYKFPYKEIIDDNIINHLFNCLKWCIKEKHIKL